MSLTFSPEKNRVHCDGCRQFQPVMTQEIDEDLTLVCSACLHPISSKPADLGAACAIIKGELPAVETSVTLTEKDKKALGQAKPLPKPQADTRPAPVEGAR